MKRVIPKFTEEELPKTVPIKLSWIVSYNAERTTKKTNKGSINYFPIILFTSENQILIINNTGKQINITKRGKHKFIQRC